MTPYACSCEVSHLDDGAIRLSRVVARSGCPQSAVLSRDTVCRLMHQGFSLKNIRLDSFYPREGIRFLHSHILTPEEKSARLSELQAMGITWSPDERLVIMHGRSNPLDCNAESLLYGPHSLNMQMVCARPQAARGKFFGRLAEYTPSAGVGFRDRNPRHCTRAVRDVEEALHAMDCLKMHLLVKRGETGRARFLLQHSMHKPAGYARFYDVETLAARYESLYKARKASQRTTKRTTEACRVVRVTEDMARELNRAIARGEKVTALPNSLSGLSADIVNTLVQSRKEFDTERDVVYEYRGPRGLAFQGCVWRTHYKRFLAHTAPHLKAGYPSIGPNRLHRLVCWAEGMDIQGRMVQHSFDARFDSRASSLTPDEGVGDGSNPRSVNRKTAASQSAYPGVSRKGQRWVARIRFCRTTAHLGSFSEEAEAAACYKRAFDRQLDIQHAVRKMLGQGATRAEVARFIREF